MIAASIHQSIVVHEKMFRQQLRQLFLNTLFSKNIGDQEAFRANLIALLDHAYTELMRMSEVVKTYSQTEAIEHLPAADQLLTSITELHTKLKQRKFLDSDHVSAALNRVTRGVLKLTTSLRDRSLNHSPANSFNPTQL